MNNQKKLRILSLSLSYPTEGSFDSPFEETVYACINPPVDAVNSGKAISIPNGQFDIKYVVDQLPQNWEPNLISISSSLALIKDPPLPTGIQRLSFPSAMKLTDSHHMSRPLQNLIEYSKAVSCSYHWTTYNRQHIHFFRESGLKNVFWMPGSINIKPYELNQEPLDDKKYDVLFLGSRENSHPFRDSLLAFLEKSDIDVTIMRLPYQESLQAYTKSKIVFNCSLNGDFNRRVYETLMAQGFLLTDRLTPESGLPLLFSEGQHLESYGSKYELLEKIQYYLAHPDQRLNIAQKGHKKFMDSYHPEIVRQQFYNFLLKGEPLPDLYYAKEDLRNSFYCGQTTKVQDSSLENRIQVYEFLQELHRINPEIRIIYYGSNNLGLVSDVRDLPRSSITYVNSVSDLINNTNTKKSHILVIDVPSSQITQLLKDLIENFNFCFFNYHLLLFIGSVNLNQKNYLFLKSQGFAPLQLNIWQESDFSVYAKSEKQKISSEATALKISINNSEVSFKKKLRKLIQKVRSLVKLLITNNEQ